MEEKETTNESIKDIKIELQKEKFRILKLAVIGKRVGPWQDPLMTYLIMCIDDLRESTEKSSAIANRLAANLVWLTVVLAFGAIVGAIATSWNVFKIKPVIAVIVIGIFLLVGIVIFIYKKKENNKKIEAKGELNGKI